MTIANYILEQCNSRFMLQPEEELQFPKLLMDRSPNAVFLVNPEAQFLYINDAACSLVGYSREELLSMTLYDINPSFSAGVWLEHWRTIKQQGSFNFESLHRAKQGWSVPVEVKVKYLEDYGREYGCIFVSDITKRKQLEVALQNVKEAQESKLAECTSELLKLRKANEQLCHEMGAMRATLEHEKELSAQKACFISMVAHEFRHPLHIVSFSVSLLQRYTHQWTEEKKRPYLDRIQAAIAQLNQLMDEVFLLGRAEAGKTTCEPVAFNLEQFCRDLIAQLQLRDRTQHIFNFLSQGECTKVCLDRKLLQQILTNLLENAMKYSPPGSTVDLELYYRDQAVIFQIKDRGIGIPAADRQRLFEPFHRGKNVGNIPGSGLGLAVVKKLVDIHSGQISVASEVGIGTTFTVVLP